MESIKILDTTYTKVDTKEKMTVADSFVKRQNKIMTGNGEAKFYLGNEGTEIRGLFGNKGFKVKCFLLKRDLLQYMKDVEAEYKNPEQPYRYKDQMPTYWSERITIIERQEEIIWFTLVEQTQIAGPRIYAKSSDFAFDLIREISLPFITYLAAIKLKDKFNNELFYFRLFVDYFGDVEHPREIIQEEQKIAQEIIPDDKKRELNYARVGQGKYRKQVLDECPFCPITMVTDDRLLIASHIKPWVKSDDKEKLDCKNGFMFTPTYDFLFDRGFISFTNRREMIVSPWLSKMTCSKLNISDNKKYPMLPVDGREDYLQYHRENIFKS